MYVAKNKEADPNPNELLLCPSALSGCERERELFIDGARCPPPVPPPAPPALELHWVKGTGQEARVLSPPPQPPSQGWARALQAPPLPGDSCRSVSGLETPHISTGVLAHSPLLSVSRTPPPHLGVSYRNMSGS